LELAAPSFECVGLEPSPSAAAQVRAKGIPIIEASFESADIQPQSFDLVTMDAVIEHVRHPLEVLKKTNTILRKDGIVALKTPKFGGPAYRLHDSGWNGFRHGYHLFLFTGKTLGALMRAAGFEVLRRPKRDRILDDILILWGRKVKEVEDPGVALNDGASPRTAA
jgi:SAM-dependent methyltransferase